MLLTPPFLPAELRKELGSASDRGQSELCSQYQLIAAVTPLTAIEKNDAVSPEYRRYTS